MSKKNLFAVDIEEEIERYAWEKFKDEKKIASKKDHYVDIQWRFVKFTHETIRFEERQDEIHGVPTEALPHVSTKKRGGDGPELQMGCKKVPLYTSEYKNKTQKDQQYSFNTSRETTASASVQIQQGFTIGSTFNIEIGVKDIMKIGAGLSGQLSITKTAGQTFEEKLNWELVTQITVEAGQEAKVTMKVSEKTATYDFEVRTTVSILGGKQIPVAVRRRSDDENVLFIPISDFQPVFHNLAKTRSQLVQLKEEKYPGDDQSKKDLILITHGTCKSVSWLNQQVEVESKKIEESVNGKKKDDKEMACGGSG